MLVIASFAGWGKNRDDFELQTQAHDTADDVALTNGVISYRDPLNAAVISFSSPLPVGSYQGVVTTGVTDLAGKPLAADFRWTFIVFSIG
jgi:hypothetical protein